MSDLKIFTDNIEPTALNQIYTLVKQPAFADCKEFFTEEHGNQTGLYCSACGKWRKWLKKDEIRLFNHGVKVENASLLERLKARIEESAIKVSTVKAPHTYMKAVGTRELEKILEEELGNEDTKRHTC